MTDYISQTETNKLIRKVLKESFPGVKFSVRTRGGSTNINWTDGPNSKQVEHLIGVFEGSYFDGMIDYKGSRFAWLDGREVSFMADFIFCNRHSTPELELRIVKRISKQYAHQCDYLRDTPFHEIIEDWHQGRLFSTYPFGGEWSNANSLCQMLHNQCAKHTFNPFPQPSPTLDRVTFKGDDGYGAGCVGRDGKGEGYGGYPKDQHGNPF